MSADFQAGIEQIHTILGISLDGSQLVANLQERFSDPGKQQKIVEHMKDFLRYFDMFKGITALFQELTDILKGSFEICEKVEDYPDLLMKSILLRIIEIYIDHSPYQDKEKILKTLAVSFEILAPSALIINLGLMAKPIFTDPEYLTGKKKDTVIEIKKVDNSALAQKLKNSIDSWIRQQNLNPEFQEQHLIDLITHFETIAAELGLNPETPEFNNLLLESQEMVNMQLTAMSLMMDFGDEDLSPQPII